MDIHQLPLSSYNDGLLDENGKKPPPKELVPDKDFGVQNLPSLLTKSFSRNLRGFLGIPVKEVDVLKAIFSQAKEKLTHITAKTPVEFLQRFREELHHLDSRLGESFVPQVALKAITYFQVILLSTKDLTDESGFRPIFDHFRELITTYHEQLFPEVRARSGDVFFIPWDELERVGLMKGSTVNASIFGKKVDPNNPVQLHVGHEHAYKGGYARMLSKGYLLARFAEIGLPIPEILKKGAKAEYPPADVDAILKQMDPKLLKLINIEQKDAEWNPALWREEKPNPMELRKYFDRRDLVFNEAIVFPGDGLYVTKEALQQYVDGDSYLGMMEFDAFGIYSYFLGGEEHLCPKALFRLINPMLGGYEEINAHTFVRTSKLHAVKFTPNQTCPNDLGIYWMPLLRKSLFRKDAVERMLQMHSLALQMGATQNKDPIDWWKNQIKKCLHFDFNRKEQTESELVTWFAGKIIDYVHRIIRKDFEIKSPERGQKGSHLNSLCPDDTAVLAYLSIPENKKAMENFVGRLRKIST